jgi:hypothetical protein
MATCDLRLEQRVLRFETEDETNLQRHRGLSRERRQVLPVSGRHRKGLFDEGRDTARKGRAYLIPVKGFGADDKDRIELCFVQHRLEFGEPSRLTVTTDDCGDFIRLWIADCRQFNPWQVLKDGGV